MLNIPTFRLTFLLLLLLELISFYAYIVPVFGSIAYVIILAVILAATLHRLEIGVYIAFAELVVGSKGYLLVLPLGGIDLSLRMGIFLIVMTVWFGNFVVHSNVRTDIRIFFHTSIGKACVIFALAIGWGVVRGITMHHSFTEIFFDVNNYLYGALLLPLLTVYRTPAFFKIMCSVITSAAVLLAIKTLWLVLWFSHHLWYWWEPVYHWIRNTGIGEITQLVGGVSRIFLQSQIFHVVGLCIVLALLTVRVTGQKEYQKNLSLWLLAALFVASLFASGSRSFWVGIVTGLLFACVLPIILTGRWTKSSGLHTIQLLKISVLVGVFGVILAWMVAVVPLPGLGTGSLDVSVLAQRATTFTGEAGVASRWSLLPPLFAEIKKSPLAGEGFGASVTYSYKIRVYAQHILTACIPPLRLNGGI